MKHAFQLLKEAYNEWRADNGARMAAAVAYYTLFSIGPLLLLSVAIAAAIFGQEAGRQRFENSVARFLGSDTASAITDILQAANQSGMTTASIIGIAVLMWAASNVFFQLTDSLHDVFRADKPKGGGIMGFIKQRAVSLLLVLCVGLLVLSSIILSVTLTAISRLSQDYVSTDLPIWSIVEWFTAVAILTGAYTLLYRLIPQEKQPNWKSALLGGAVSGVLFGVLKILFSFYISNFNPGSAYGAAGSVVVLLLLVYFGSLVFFFGAEVAKVHQVSGPQREFDFEGAAKG